MYVFLQKLKIQNCIHKNTVFLCIQFFWHPLALISENRRQKMAAGNFSGDRILEARAAPGRPLSLTIILNSSPLKLCD